MMYTHISKCKNDKMKGEIEKGLCFTEYVYIQIHIYTYMHTYTQ
jgi:hypothetical protein